MKSMDKILWVLKLQIFQIRGQVIPKYLESNIKGQ